MKIVIPAYQTPTTFAIGIEDRTLHILSPCCLAKLKRSESSKLAGLPGVTSGPVRLECFCGCAYVGYTDTSRDLNHSLGPRHWVEPWTELKDVEVIVEDA